VGGEGLSAWLISVLPLLPRPGAKEEGEGEPDGQAHDRVTELARALTECASDRARAHFQASRYFADNQVLARRVKALEAMLATRARARLETSEAIDDVESERATRRYLPRGNRL